MARFCVARCTHPARQHSTAPPESDATMRTTAHQITTATTTTPATPAQRPWRHALPAALLCACMTVGLLATPCDAQAARKKKDGATSSQATAKKGSVKVKYFGSSSEESTSQRDRRLYRECKGRPDAGACLGYTRR